MGREGHVSLSGVKPSHLYLKVCIEFEDHEEVAVNHFEFKNMIMQSLEACYGEVGKSIQVDVLKYIEETREGLLRCPAKHFQQLYTAAVFLHQINEKTCAMRILQHSGNLVNMAVDSRREKLCFKTKKEVS